MRVPLRRAVRRAPSPLQRAVTAACVAASVVVLVVVTMLLARPTYRATSLISTSPLTSTGQQGNPTAEQADRFLSSELLYLNSTALRSGVQTRLRLAAEPTISAGQAGRSDVLEVTARDRRGEQAERLADTAVTLYLERRRAQLTATLDEVKEQLAALDATIASLGPGTAARREGLELEYQRLLSTRNDLQVDLGGADAVIETAAAAGARRVVPVPLALGFLVVATSGLLLLVQVARRWSSGWVMDSTDVAELGGRVAGPPLPCVDEAWPRLLRDRDSSDPLETAARLVAGSLCAARPGAPLVLVGPTPGVGTSFTALNTAVSLSRSRQTVLLLAGDALVDGAGDLATVLGVPDRASGLADVGDRALDRETLERLLVPTGVPGLSVIPAGRPGARRTELVERALSGPLVGALHAAGYQVVVDAPALDRSRAAYGLAPDKPTVGLVVGAGVTGDRELHDALADLTLGGLDVAGVVLDLVPAAPAVTASATS